MSEIERRTSCNPGLTSCQDVETRETKETRRAVVKKIVAKCQQESIDKALQVDADRKSRDADAH